MITSINDGIYQLIKSIPKGLLLNKYKLKILEMSMSMHTFILSCLN